MTIKTTLVSDECLNVVIRAHSQSVKELTRVVETTIDTMSAEFNILYSEDIKDLDDAESKKMFLGYVTNFLEAIRAEVYSMNVTGDDSAEDKATRILNINRTNTVVAKLLNVEINEISIVADIVVVDTYSAFYREMQSQALEDQEAEVAKREAWDCKLEGVEAPAVTSDEGPDATTDAV